MSLGKLGNFELLEKIAQGGMGVVYRGLDRGLNRLVAIKQTRLSDIDDEGEAKVLRDRLVREAQAAASLKHEGIVTIYYIGEDSDGNPFIAMELVEGPTIEHVLKTPEAFDQDLFRRVFLVAADALDMAHRGGIIHRDIKPANIMLSKANLAFAGVKICDFGIAKVTAPGFAPTQTGIALGTAYYMSPEQLKGAKNPSGAMDQYALALVAYEVLAGQRAFSGETIANLQYNILNEYPTPASEINHLLDPEVDAVLFQGMAKDASQRFPSCLEFARALMAAADRKAGWRPFVPVQSRVVYDSTLALDPSANPMLASGSQCQCGNWKAPGMDLCASCSRFIRAYPEPMPAATERPLAQPAAKSPVTAGGGRARTGPTKVPDPPGSRSGQAPVQAGTGTGAPTIHFDAGPRAVQNVTPPPHVPSSSGTVWAVVGAVVIVGLLGGGYFAYQKYVAPTTVTNTTPLSINAAVLPEGTVNTAYSANVSSTGGQAPVAWSVAQGTLPPGITLAKEGRLQGTPNRSGLYRFQLEARDAGGHAASISVSITVSAPVSVTGPELVAKNQPVNPPPPQTKQVQPPPPEPKSENKAKFPPFDPSTIPTKQAKVIEPAKPVQPPPVENKQPEVKQPEVKQPEVTKQPETKQPETKQETKQVPPPVAPAKIVRLDSYGGPRTGRIAWTGQLGADGLVTIDGDLASVGRLQGKGFIGLEKVVVTVTPSDVVKVVQAPTEQNRWRKLVLEVSDRNVSSITINWRVQQ